MSATGTERISKSPVSPKRANGRGDHDHPPTDGPSARLNSLNMTVDAFFNGLEHEGGFYGRLAGHDIARFRAGTRRYVSLTHPDYIDHVFHAGVVNYHKSYEYETLKTVLHRSLFTDEEESWKRHRKMITPMFAKRHLDGLIGLMVEPIAELVDRIEAAGDGAEVDVVGEMIAVTLDVVGNSLFSQQFDVFGDMGDLVTKGLRSGEQASRLFLVAPPPLPVLDVFRWALGAGPRLPAPFGAIQEIIKTLDDGVWQVINERRENPRETPDLLNHLLSASDEEGKMELRRVRNEALTFMLAGHETTANAMSWLWYLLSINPHVRDRMLKEVDAVLEGRTPGVEDLPSLPFTTACVQESMRYYSPAWILPRVAIEDDEINGHRIRKGTTVLIPTHLVHHDERWWDRPEEFDPTRFLGDAPKQRPRSSYLPFAGGRRICIGTSFALMEATLITAMLSQRFVLDLVPGHPVVPETAMTLRPRYGLKMIARHRDTAEVAA